MHCEHQIANMAMPFAQKGEIRLTMTGSFLFIVAFAVFFGILGGTHFHPKTRNCPYCYSTVFYEAQNCPHCTRRLPNPPMFHFPSFLRVTLISFVIILFFALTR